MERKPRQCVSLFPGGTLYSHEELLVRSGGKPTTTGHRSQNAKNCLSRAAGPGCPHPAVVRSRDQNRQPHPGRTRQSPRRRRRQPQDQQFRGADRFTAAGAFRPRGAADSDGNQGRRIRTQHPRRSERAEQHFTEPAPGPDPACAPAWQWCRHHRVPAGRDPQVPRPASGRAGRNRGITILGYRQGAAE